MAAGSAGVCLPGVAAGDELRSTSRISLSRMCRQGRHAAASGRHRKPKCDGIGACRKSFARIDFGEKWIQIAGARTKVHFFVAVLGYSRRIFVRASLSQRQDDWREGLAGAFRAFGGVTRKILIDRAGALVIGEDRQTGTARVHPAFAAFSACVPKVLKGLHVRCVRVRGFQRTLADHRSISDGVCWRLPGVPGGELGNELRSTSRISLSRIQRRHAVGFVDLVAFGHD